MSDDPMAETDPMADTEQCTATASSTGERCKQPAIPGGTVCRFHGGNAEQVQEKAQERLDRLAREVLEESEPQLFDLIESYDTADTIDEKVTALREIRQWTTSILDRSPEAPNPTETTEVTGEGGDEIQYSLVIGEPTDG